MSILSFFKKTPSVDQAIRAQLSLTAQARDALLECIEIAVRTCPESPGMKSLKKLALEHRKLAKTVDAISL